MKIFSVLITAVSVLNTSAITARAQTAPVLPTPQHHAAILEIIALGDKAQSERNAQDMEMAANLLTRIGAKPINTQSLNLAENWIQNVSALKTPTAQPAFRGRVKGSAYRQGILPAGKTETLEEIYYASEKAELTLKAPTGLNLTIAEQTTSKTPQSVCSLHTGKVPVSCQWLPLWTAKYNIVIHNHSQKPVSYLLVTN